MKTMKIINSFLILLLAASSVEAKIAMVQKLTGFCNGNFETWYIGSNEQAIRFNKKASGGIVDDGLFVAVEDGGPYEGFSYFDLVHPIGGVIDGGPAQLPPNPGTLPMSGHFPVARRGNCRYNSGPPIPAEKGSLVVGRRGQLKDFPDGAILPIGSKFFFWVSGGGSYNLSSYIVEELKSHRVLVKTQAIPKPEYDKWFEPSNILERAFTLIEN